MLSVPELAYVADLEAIQGNLPRCLRDLAQWVCWRYVERDGHQTKCPISPTKGGPASSVNPGTWGTFEQALTACQRCSDLAGVGFVCSSNDSFVGIDLDNCIEFSGEIKPWALEIIQRLSSFSEISPSGRGVRIFVRASKSGPRCKRKYEDGVVEIYDRKRFLTVTGSHVPSTPSDVEERQSELDALYASLFRDRGGEASAAGNQPPRLAEPNAYAPANDDDIIRILETSKIGGAFKRLWQGHWKNDNGRYPSQNEADLALISYLTFICGADHERIDRLFRRSGLYREKWDRADYRERTINKALEGKTAFYRPSHGDDNFQGGQSLHANDKGGSDSADENVDERPALASDEASREQAEANHETREIARRPIDRARVGQPYPMTDLGNAERLMRRFGDELRYCHPTQEWLVWTRQRWTCDKSGRVMQMAAQTARHIYEEAAYSGDKDRAKHIADWATKSESRQRLEAMVVLARSQPSMAVTPDALDADTWLLNVQNGTIDLRTGHLHRHRPLDLITKMACTGYDPAAPCPLWHRFFDRIFVGDSGLIRFVQRCLGMSLTGDVREQLLPIFYGEGNNGKNVLLDTVCGIMGDYATEAAPELLTVSKHHEHPTEIADLCGRRLVIASETEEAASLRLQLVKRLTGNARLKGRFMRRDYFEFNRTHKLILVTNNRPIIRENTEAVWRRIRLVPFNVVIPPEERDLHLLQKLKAEWSGILAWLVQGCLEWQREGLGEPTAVAEATSGYRTEQDFLSEFIAERCTLRSDAWVGRATVLRSYQEWSQLNGERRPLERSALFDRLRRLDGVSEGWGQEHGKGTRGFRGIGVQANASGDHGKDM